MSEFTHESFENLLRKKDDNSVGDKCKEVSGPGESVGIREFRQRRRSLLKVIQEYSEEVVKLNSEIDVLKFEEEKVIQLDWEVRDFLKSVRDLEDSEGPTGLMDRIGGDFEALVLLCKSRSEELAKNRSKPPSIQLGKSSQSIGKSITIASEIIDDELELVKLQADAKAAEAERQAKLKAEAAKAKAEAEAEAEAAKARAEAEILKKQAQIKAKQLKQSMGTGSHRSGSSSKSGSRKSGRKSLIPSLIDDIDRRLPIWPLESELKNSLSNARRPGSPLGAAATFKPQTVTKTANTSSGSFSGAAKVSRFGKTDRYPGVNPQIKQRFEDPNRTHLMATVNENASALHLNDILVEQNSKPKVDIAVRQGRDDQHVPCPPGFEGINPAPFTHVHDMDTGISGTLGNAPNNSYHVHPQVKRDTEEVRALDGSRKDFLDEAVLIGFDGTNMPYVMFYNQIMNLMARCPYPDRKLPILRAACVRSAAQTIAVVISDTPGFDDNTKITMGLSRLEQRFGRSGGFVNEPEVRRIRNGPKLSSTSGASWKNFKDELTQCYVFAHSYKKPDVLEGRLVVDLARRLPSYAKQRYLDYLKDRFGSTNEPTFGSLMAFVEHEEECKSSDFAVQLMADEKSERAGTKSNAGNDGKSSGYFSMKVKKTSAQFGDNYNSSFKASEQPVLDNRNNVLAVVPPQCFVCNFENCESRHRVVISLGQWSRLSAKTLCLKLDVVLIV